MFQQAVGPESPPTACAGKSPIRALLVAGLDWAIENGGHFK